MRYLQRTDAGRVSRSKAKKVLMLMPYIDEQVEMIAWNSGETLPLLGRIKEDGSYVIRSRKTGLEYVVDESLANRMLLEKI